MSIRLASPRLQLTPVAAALQVCFVGLAFTAAGARAADESETALPPVRVQSTAPGSAGSAYRVEDASLGALGAKKLRDTPFTVDVFSRDLMDNKQVSSLADVLKGDAAITPNTNGINGLTTEIVVRGSTVDFYNSYKIDGLNMLGWSTELPLEHYESVEVLKGAGGFMYGFGAPGAIINYVSKRPTNTPLRSVTTSVTGSGTVLLHGDVGGRFGDDARFGYRVNLVDEQGDTYVDDGGHIKRRSGSVALDWRITPDIVWSVDALHQERTVHAAYFGVHANGSGDPADWDVIGAPPAAIDGSRRLASSFTYYRTRATTYGTEVNWRFAPDWNARVAYRSWEQRRIPYYSRFTAAPDGTYSEIQLASPGRTETEQVQGIVTGKVVTGPVAHDLVFGASRSRFSVGESLQFDGGVIGTGNLSNPDNFPDPGRNAAWEDGGFLRAERQRALFVSDTVHLGSQWDVLVGLRHNKFDREPYSESKVTPTFAVIHRPLSWLSAYASYVESLEQGATAPLLPQLSNPGQVFPPLKSKQAEIGLKAEADDWSASVALFRMIRPLDYLRGNTYTQDGRSQYNGLELSGKARLARDWTVTASGVLLDAKNKKTLDSDGDGVGDLDGKRVTGTSRGQVAGYVEYNVPLLPLVLSGGGRYVSARYHDNQNNYTLPAYTLIDLGARYTTRIGGTDTTFRFNIDNVADKAYWLGSDERLTQGAPRTYKLSAQAKF